METLSTHSPSLSARLSATSRKRQARSRVSNGKELLPGVDGRSLVARRYRDVANAILTDQADGANCTEARLQLIRRFSAAAVLAEQLEARLANGEAIDIAEHALLCSTLTRLAQRIGIDRATSRNTRTLSAAMFEPVTAEELADVVSD